MSLGGGDKLARGNVRADFGPADVSEEKWKEIWGKEGERKLNNLSDEERAKMEALMLEAEKKVEEIVQAEEKERASKPVGFRAVQDRIIIRRVESEDKVGNLYLPDEGKEKPAEGIVVAVGPGKYRDGELQKVTIAIGERVVFGKFAGQEVKVGLENYLVLREEDIFLVKETKG